MTDTDPYKDSILSDDPSTMMPFKTGNGHYDPAVAKTFFKAFGQREKIPAGTTVFVENEKSKRQSILTKPLGKALTTPIDQHMFSKKNIHRMFLLTDGEVLLTAGGKMIGTVSPGDIFGEMAVVSEIPDIDTEERRSATAAATIDCTGYSLDANEALTGLAKQPEFALMLMSVMFERLRLLAARLAAHSGDEDHHSSRGEVLFNPAMLKALQKKLESATVVRFAKDAHIFKEGKAGTSMYVVLEGDVAVTIGRKIVEKLGPGGVFGEIALVDQSPRAAGALARSECSLLSVNRDALISMVKSDPALGMAMMRSVAARLRYMNSLFV